MEWRGKEWNGWDYILLAAICSLSLRWYFYRSHLTQRVRGSIFFPFQVNTCTKKNERLFLPNQYIKYFIPLDSVLRLNPCRQYLTTWNLFVFTQYCSQSNTCSTAYPSGVMATNLVGAGDKIAPILDTSVLAGISTLNIRTLHVKLKSASACSYIQSHSAKTALDISLSRCKYQRICF